MSSTTIVIGPADADDSGASAGATEGSGQASNSRRPGTIPTRDECLIGIAALNSLLVMRMITPAQANSMRANFMAMLRQYEPARQSPSAHLANESVLEIWRASPGLIDLLEPLLSAEQLEIIMREVRRDAG